jgi:D-sedoheptulose 7-phosphate isomerase
MDSEKFSPDEYLRLVAKSALALINSEEYEQILNILLNCYQQKGTVFVMGCGGSASTATHFAADLAKTTITNDNLGFKTMSLVDNIPLVSAWTNDKGWDKVFEGQLKAWLTKNDVLVGFSVHGGSKLGDEAGSWSQNLISAMNLAKQRKAKIIGFSGFDGGALKDMADGCIVISTKSETYGTPLIEAMHVVIHHQLIFDLKERIRSGQKRIP